MSLCVCWFAVLLFNWLILTYVTDNSSLEFTDVRYELPVTHIKLMLHYVTNR